MTTFADVVDAAAHLSADEQQSLIDILQRRMTEENRKQLRCDVDEARKEFAQGQAAVSSVADLMNEIRRDS